MKTFLVQHGSAAGIRLSLLALLGGVVAVAAAYGLGCFLDGVQRWALFTTALATCLQN